MQIVDFKHDHIEQAMQIVDFKQDHIEQAMQIAKVNYEEERLLVPMLPKVDVLPDLKEFADNELGVSAFENGRMIGYLCGYKPINDAWGTTNAKGTFSPIHAHGTISEGKSRIYSLLYQAVADKWVKEGIISHAIALYAHDQLAINSFFYNGFGLRCIDAIRFTNHIPLINSIQCEYGELPKDEWYHLLELQNLLLTHLRNSPTFMPYPFFRKEKFLERLSEDTRFFVAKENNKCIAFIKIGSSGENFACDDSSMMNICGAYCLPEYRGIGVYNNLLSNLVLTLIREGYTRLGVDFESFNPTARGFWLKHFTEYTKSVVRRIDDKINLEL